MQLRHRRKAKQRATTVKHPTPALDTWSMGYRQPGKSRVMRLLQEVAAKQEAARTTSTVRVWLDECWLPLDPAFQCEMEQRYMNLLVHGHSHPEHFQQEFPSWPPL